MANHWLRLWHEMPNDPKWRTIARIANQPISLVLSTYLHLMVSASKNEPRGTVRVRVEDLASALDVDDAAIEIILNAMQGRVLAGDDLSGWAERQPAREDGAEGGKAPGSNYVYYVATTDSDVVKVGISRNPWSRVRDLQTGSAEQFTLLATLKTDARSEFAIHDFFKATRVKGEWFSRSPALNSLIQKTKDGEFADLEACVAFLHDLPVEAFVATTVERRSSVVTTKDKDKEESSVAKATGDKSPPPDPIFGTGLAYLVGKGLDQKLARSFLGKLRKDAGDIETIRALNAAVEQDITDPVPWLTKAVQVRSAAPERKPWN